MRTLASTLYYTGNAEGEACTFEALFTVEDLGIQR